MAFKVTPISSGMGSGVEVTGLDPNDLTESDVRLALRELWVQEGVVVFRGLEGANVHVALSEVFGPCERHPLKPNDEPKDIPALVNVRYTPDGSNGMIWEVDGEELASWLPSHFDLVYVDKVNHGGLLRPIVLPKEGYGQTIFHDKIGLYDSLPEHLKAKIEGLHVLYKIDLYIDRQKFGRVKSLKLKSMASKFTDIMSREAAYPRVIHPLVYEQAETGRKMLNFSPWFALGVYGMENDEGDALLREIGEHCSNQARTYSHDWRNGDMVLWDNWRNLHGAAGIPPDGERWLQRTTIAGDYALGRKEHAQAEIDDRIRINV